MITRLIDLFFPHVCAGCSVLIQDFEKVLCTKCRHELPLTNHHLRPDNEAAAKFYGLIPVEHVSAMCYFQSEGVVRNMIHKLKYRGQQQVGAVLGHWYGSVLKTESRLSEVSDQLTIVPVPLHRRRRWQRGYNQTETFAKAIAASLQAVYDPSILTRQVYAKTQTGKNRLARSSKRDIFLARQAEGLENKHFLLVDDVMTTGSTLVACANALLKIPQAKISVVCIAYSNT
jgi:ComF family protein